MPKLYIAFHDNGVVRDIGAQDGDGYLPLPGKNPSTLALRYALQDGKVIDGYPNQTDEDVLTTLKAEQDSLVIASQANAVKVHTRLDFMNRFTMEELAGIYTAAKSEVLVEVFLDKLKLAEHVDLADPNTVAGVKALVVSGLLTEARAGEILQ